MQLELCNPKRTVSSPTRQRKMPAQLRQQERLVYPAENCATGSEAGQDPGLVSPKTLRPLSPGLRGPIWQILPSVKVGIVACCACSRAINDCGRLHGRRSGRGAGARAHGTYSTPLVYLPHFS
jgi:hypothetical protein